MTRTPPTIREDESVADATAKLVAHNSTNLPVVDGKGRYAGMFGVCDLLSLLVPRVALAGNLMANLRFIGDDAEELRRKFHQVKGRRVSEVADRNCATLDPELAEIEVIRLFSRDRGPLPVVEKTSGKVVGTVSYREVLASLRGCQADTPPSPGSSYHVPADGPSRQLEVPKTEMGLPRDAGSSREARQSKRTLAPFWRGAIEAGFIIFLFYSNLLMGEFTRSNSANGKSLAFAIADIFTVSNFGIGVVSALIGYAIVEYLRKKL
jgi:CBS domain-containing protein